MDYSYNSDKVQSLIPVYQYHAEQKDGWRFHYSTNDNLGSGWIFDKMAFKTPQKDSPNTVYVYQYHCDQSKTYGGWRFHFSTNNNMGQGWTFDNYAFSAFLNFQEGTVPVYQYHAVQSDGWRFMFSVDPNIQAGWIRDGIMFYVYSANYSQINEEKIYTDDIFQCKQDIDQLNSKLIPIYEYHAEQKDGWRFHYSSNEALGQGWNFDKLTFYTPPQDFPNSIQVYQFHYDQSKTYGGWRFNFSTNKNFGQGWTFDNYAFSAFQTQYQDTVPVYQYHAVQTDGWRYMFSVDPDIKSGWIMDNIAFYVYKQKIELFSQQQYANYTQVGSYDQYAKSNDKI